MTLQERSDCLERMSQVLKQNRLFDNYSSFLLPLTCQARSLALHFFSQQQIF